MNLCYFSRLTHEQFNILTSKVVSLFPNEYPGTYYVPAVKKSESKSGRPVLAKGKLVDKCKNLLHSCADVIPRKRKSANNEELHTNKKLSLENLDGINMKNIIICFL